MLAPKRAGGHTTTLIWTNVSGGLGGMWVGGKGGGALDITRIVPSECTKGSLIRVWLTT